MAYNQSRIRDNDPTWVNGDDFDTDPVYDTSNNIDADPVNANGDEINNIDDEEINNIDEEINNIDEEIDSDYSEDEVSDSDDEVKDNEPKKPSYNKVDIIDDRFDKEGNLPSFDQVGHADIFTLEEFNKLSSEQKKVDHIIYDKSYQDKYYIKYANGQGNPLDTIEIKLTFRFIDYAYIGKILYANPEDHQKNLDIKTELKKKEEELEEIARIKRILKHRFTKDDTENRPFVYRGCPRKFRFHLKMKNSTEKLQRFYDWFISFEKTLIRSVRKYCNKAWRYASGSKSLSVKNISDYIAFTKRFVKNVVKIVFIKTSSKNTCGMITCIDFKNSDNYISLKNMLDSFRIDAYFNKVRVINLVNKNFTKYQNSTFRDCITPNEIHDNICFVLLEYLNTWMNSIACQLYNQIADNEGISTDKKLVLLESVNTVLFNCLMITAFDMEGRYQSVFYDPEVEHDSYTVDYFNQLKKRNKPKFDDKIDEIVNDLITQEKVELIKKINKKNIAHDNKKFNSKLKGDLTKFEKTVYHKNFRSMQKLNEDDYYGSDSDSDDY